MTRITRMVNMLVCGMLALLVLALASPAPAAEYVWHEYNGHWYAETKVTSGWAAAEAEAVSQGGHLVTINDAAENAWLVDTFPAGWYCIGLHQVDGQWVWTSGETVTYTNWWMGYPTGERSDAFIMCDKEHLGADRLGFWYNFSDTHPGLIERNTPPGSQPPGAQCGTWTTVAPMLNSRMGPAGGVINGQFYVVSGSALPGGATNAVEAFDPSTNTWTLKAPIPTNRASAGAGVIDGKLYVVGGCIGSDCLPGLTNVLEVYDPMTNTWTRLANMPTARVGMAVGVIDGKLYVAGGMQQCGPCIGLNTLEVYDPETNTWSTKASMPTARTAVSGAVIDGQLYVVGGNQNPGLNIFNTLEVYDPINDAWATLAPMPTPRYNLATGVVNGILYAVSGNNATGAIDTVEAYDPVTNSWKTCTPIPTPRTASAAGVINGVLYVAGSQPYPSPWSATVEAFTPHRPPVANAGLDQTVRPGATVNLNGSGSSSPDGNLPLTYQWRFVSWPEGSAAMLSGDTMVSPSFLADTSSMTPWVLELVVTDSLGLKSTPATVKISTENSPPVADAGPDQAVTLVDTTVFLGTETNRQSYDLDGDPITYLWELLDRPTGSEATLTNPTTATPSFVPDKHGDYVVQLVASDPWAASDPDPMTVSFANVAPLANAGAAQSVVIGATVNLNGSGSSDANGDPLIYKWDLKDRPADSTLSFTADKMEPPPFTPDVPGDYVVQLIVNDGSVDSPASTVQIQVSVCASWISEQIRGVIQTIGGLPPNTFKNQNMRNTLINKLQVIIKQMDGGKYSEALAKLNEDVISKTNGCDLGDRPDQNDWVTNCESQGLIYPALMDIDRYLQELMSQE